MLPPCSNDRYGILPPGSHPSTLAEVYERFVLQAPFTAERDRLWSVIPAYVSQVTSIARATLLVLGGGFVTHKTWAAPEDIDVLVGVELEKYQALQVVERGALFNTQTGDGQKIRVMGGFVDSRRFDPHNEIQAEYLHAEWSSVRGPDGRIIDTMTKGYVEVVL